MGQFHALENSGPSPCPSRSSELSQNSAASHAERAGSRASAWAPGRGLRLGDSSLPYARWHRCVTSAPRWLFDLEPFGVSHALFNGGRKEGRKAELRKFGAFAILTVAAALPAQGQQASSFGQPPQDTFATVYRDTQGMPHIVAETERTAWYALGYEQARDALLWIQYSCKAAKGELVWVRGLDSQLLSVANDFAVSVFNSYGRLASMTVAQRRAWFAPTNQAIQANFYDNCEAFAAGANAYRLAVMNAPASPLTPERRLRNWLSSNALFSNTTPAGQTNLSWVFTHPITGLDIAAQGGWTAALMSFHWPGDGLVNSSGDSFGLTGGSTSEIEPTLSAAPLSPQSVDRFLAQLRQRLSVVTGAPTGFSGSNSFAWSGLYCKDAAPGTTTYSGLLADPHQPIPFLPDFKQGFYYAPNHLWFAHVKVTPPGASQPSLDLLGHFPHASAATFSSHNRSVAMGGTLGSPNNVDTFLLRLREGPGGVAAQPNEFYSYYHDSIPPSNATWRPITTHQFPIKLPNNSIVNVNYWRADSFGVILPTRTAVGARLNNGGTPGIQPPLPVVFGERVDPSQPIPRWRVSYPADPQPMRFWGSPQLTGQPAQLITSPMVVSLRAPIDNAVDGGPMHWKLLRDFWELSHATQISDTEILPFTNGAAYFANVCFVDRAGRTFTTQLSAMPERGDITDMYAAGYRTLDKWQIYTELLPVPARHFGDKIFDWRFGTTGTPVKPAPLRYLPYPTVAQPVLPFKPMTLQDPVLGTAFPAQFYPPAPAPFRIESGYFAGACNDMIWGFSRKRDVLLSVDTSATAPFSNFTFDNRLFQLALNAGVAYATPVIAFEGPSTQQIVVSRFTRQAEQLVRFPPAGLPPLTPAEMRQFVVTPELYSDTAYVPPTGVTANQGLPTTIRMLKEVAAQHAFSSIVNGKLYESPLETAKQELKFFFDLWNTLYVTNLWASHAVVGSSPGLQVNLRELWVNGSVSGNPSLQDKVFWYDNPTAQTGLRWIDLPAPFPLIDFFWQQTDVSRGVNAGSVDPGGLSTSELTSFQNLVTRLVNSDPAGPHYRNVPSSTGACLLEMMQAGYGGFSLPQAPNFGRNWVRLKRGQVEYASSGFAPLTATGQLPGGGSLVKQARGWGDVKSIAFRYEQLSTLMQPLGVAVPYDALYSNIQTRTVRTVLLPEHTNKLVKFFLELGGHYIEPASNNGNPSRKLARFQLLDSSEERFLARGYPAGYPLSDGLMRLTAVRALLDAGAFLQTISPSGPPPMSQCFRARAYDHTGQIWPALPQPPLPQVSDDPCVGASLRAVGWNEDFLHPGYVVARGYQPKFLGLMVAMFPSVGQGVDSHFWCTPGIEVMGSSPTRYNAHMNAYATNTLLPTHYDDFLNHVASTIVHTY
jgi:hypothetical protein